MRERFFVGFTLFSRQLMGAFVELCRHFCRFFRRTPQRDKDLGEIRNFHGKLDAENKNAGNRNFYSRFPALFIEGYLTESAGTIFTLVSVTLLIGRSPGRVGVV